MLNTTLTRSASTVALAILLPASVLPLVACSSGDAGSDRSAQSDCDALDHYTATPGATSLVIVLDRSRSMRDTGLDTSTTDAIATAAGVYGEVSILQVDGSGATPRWLVDNLPLNSSAYEYGTLHYEDAVTRASRCVEQRIGDGVPSASGTDLGTAIEVASDRLSGSTGRKQLIVDSDGLSNTGRIDLTGVIAQAPVHDVIERLDTERYRPLLTGVDVSFDGLGVTSGTVTAGATATWLRNYYTALCKRADAGSCAAPVSDQGATSDGTAARAAAPDDPDVGLPAVQFDLSDSEVHFAPNSAVIPDGADAAIGRIAAHVRDGSTLTVVGHSAKTGDRRAERNVSEGRAQNVAKRILQLAGDPEVTVHAFGVGATEPATPRGDTADDRRVEVSLTGVRG